MKAKLELIRSPLVAKRRGASIGATTDALYEAAVTYMEEIQRLAPGSMKSSLELSEPQIGDEAATIYVLITDPAAKFVIEGTAGPITPKVGKTLMMINEAGETVYPVAVEGQAANDFPTQARENVSAELTAIFRRFGLEFIMSGG